jgi:hypothetical protein
MEKTIPNYGGKSNEAVTLLLGRPVTFLHQLAVFFEGPVNMGFSMV